MSSNETTSDSPSGFHMFSLIIEGYSLCILSVLGFVGNLISIYILSQKQFVSPVNKLLIALASFDAIYLITSSSAFGMPQMSEW